MFVQSKVICRKIQLQVMDKVSAFCNYGNNLVEKKVTITTPFQKW